MLTKWDVKFDYILKFVKTFLPSAHGSIEFCAGFLKTIHESFPPVNHYLTDVLSGSLKI